MIDKLFLFGGSGVLVGWVGAMGWGKGAESAPWKAGRGRGSGRRGAGTRAEAARTAFPSKTAAGVPLLTKMCAAPTRGRGKFHPFRF